MTPTVLLNRIFFPSRRRPWLCVCLLLALGWAVPEPASAGVVLGPWKPIFKGIDHATGTNTPGGGGFSNLQVVHFLRVDLTDPDIELFASPRLTNYVSGGTEVGAYTTTNFLRTFQLQIAVNANQFYQPGSSSHPAYELPEGTPMNVDGLLVSRGVGVSAQEYADGSSALLFSSNNVPTFIPTNWPPVSTAGVYTAVSGMYAVLVKGVNVGSNYINSSVDPHQVEPRTAMGLSQDRRFLYILTIDGRQSGYSAGALDWETAAWLLRVGSWDGVNLDGGGSTCLVMMDSTGRPVELNHSSAIPAIGQERTVGCHFGIYAKPAPSFINDIRVLPDDTTATISWTTTSPATSQAQYGLTTNLPLATALNSTLTTNHSVLLTNLSPATDYFFSVLSSVGSTQYASALMLFATTNYVTTNQVVEFASTWSFTTANLDGVKWTTRAYDDSGWVGSGPGLLWADDRGASASIPMPMLTEMPGNPSTGYPFRTYYFRTRFTLTNTASASSLAFVDYIDDGAVFYLNGTEIYRLSMAAAPTVIYNTTLASGYFCSSGNASCPHSFAVSRPAPDHQPGRW